MPASAIYLILGFLPLNGRLPQQQKMLPRKDIVLTSALAATTSEIVSGS